MPANEPIYDNLTESQQRLVLRTNVVALNTDMTRVKGTLYEGNQKDLPLVERVRNVENYIDTLKFWFKTIAVAIVLQTITFGAAALVYFLKLYPLIEKLANNP